MAGRTAASSPSIRPANILFLSVGERQRFTPAQDPNQATGKILRLTLDGKPAPGNPMAGKVGAGTVTVIDPPNDTVAAKTAHGPQGDAARPQSHACRDVEQRPPQSRMASPSTTRVLLWEIEMGPRGGDELNLIKAGPQLWLAGGVERRTTTTAFPIPRHDTHPEFEKPVVYWTPVIAPAGLAFYYAKLFPQWRGSAFVGGLASDALIRIGFDGKGGANEAERWDMGHRIRDVKVGPDGALWLIEDEEGGRLLKLTPKK